MSSYRRPLLGTGLCGGLTTFSTMQVETIRMLEHQHYGLAVGYTAASIAAGLLAVYLATALVRRAAGAVMTAAVVGGRPASSAASGRCCASWSTARSSGRVARPFPFGTLAVNLSGALLLGFFAGAGLSPHAALLAGTAFVGSYTTFSTWMLETQRLGEERQVCRRSPTLSVSVVLGLAAAWLGQCDRSRAVSEDCSS